LLACWHPQLPALELLLAASYHELV
jgi:hypothetical protein